MSTFAQMKNSRTAQAEALTKKLQEQNAPQQNNKDDRYWKPTRDEAGNGSAVIRFLPAPAGEDLPYVQVFSHGFTGPTGKHYIERSLTTLGREAGALDPVAIANRESWNSGDQDTARKRKRNTKWHSNIYVVRDPGAPENDGKVFLFEYGKQIFDMLADAMTPPEDDLDEKVSFNPFDLWEGANFTLRVNVEDKWPSYKKSKFGTPGPLDKDDAKLEAIWNQTYSLSEIIDPSNFKSPEELKKRFDFVWYGIDSNAKSVADSSDETPWVSEEGKTSAPVQTVKAATTQATKPAVVPDEEDMSWLNEIEE